MQNIQQLLIYFKKKYIKQFNQGLTRMRNNPLIFDVCYFSCKNNLKGLKITYNLLKSKKELSILDIGCGDKPFEKFFKKTNCKFVGIDNNPDSKADIVQDISETLPFKSNSFDLIILSEVLEHLQEPIKVINEIIRVLKSDGILFMSTPFAFPIHGKPNDYFRYTEFFYKKILLKMGLKCEFFFISNSIITTPIILIMQQINFLPLLPKFIKSSILTILNILISIIEISLSPIYKFKILSSFLNSFPIGYAAVIKKFN